MQRFCKYCNIEDEIETHFTKLTNKKTGYITYRCRKYNRDAKKKRYHKNIEHSRKLARAWAAQNEQKTAEYRQKTYQKYKERDRKKHQERSHKYRQNMTDEQKTKLRQYKNAWERNRKLNPTEKLKDNLRRRLYRALKGKVKKVSAIFGLGCSIEEVKNHLERQFTNRMSWENYGTVWHVDHIRPLCSFNLSLKSEQQKAVHYTNLQPLLVEDNLKKGGSYN